MARGVIGPARGMKPGKLSGTLTERPEKMPRNPKGLSELIPKVAGVPVEGFPSDFGSGKITASKGNAGIIRPTTKPKKG